MTRELDTLEYSVSILGGYDDENSTSEEITEMLITVMQGLKARFILQLAYTGSVNTVMTNDVPWPRVYGGGVDVDTGESSPPSSLTTGQTQISDLSGCTPEGLLSTISMIPMLVRLSSSLLPTVLCRMLISGSRRQISLS